MFKCRNRNSCGEVGKRSHSIVAVEELNRGRIVEVHSGDQRKDIRGLLATESCQKIPAI